VIEEALRLTLADPGFIYDAGRFAATPKGKTNVGQLRARQVADSV
jgi:hypothetical protein